MQVQHTPKTGDGASLSRRTFMSLTATGAAMTLPAAALVGAATPDAQAALTLEAKMNECVAKLQDILAQMHPDAFIADHLLSSNGRTFIFCIAGHDPADLGGRATLSRLREDLA